MLADGARGLRRRRVDETGEEVEQLALFARAEHVEQRGLVEDRTDDLIGEARALR